MGLIQDLAKANEELRAAQVKKNQIEEAIRQLDADGPAAQLAVILYDKYGKRSDRDGEWYYEMTDGIHHWDRIMHRTFLQRAEKILKYVEQGPIDCSNIHNFIEKIL